MKAWLRWKLVYFLPQDRHTSTADRNLYLDFYGKLWGLYSKWTFRGWFIRPIGLLRNLYVGRVLSWPRLHGKWVCQTSRWRLFHCRRCSHCIRHYYTWDQWGSCRLFLGIHRWRADWSARANDSWSITRGPKDHYCWIGRLFCGQLGHTTSNQLPLPIIHLYPSSFFPTRSKR